ncbi:hypothetical protein NE865_01867 [Phthorimaea operculella]|nr:hypothetical protein NE865_01867 [Phthorimaea operculella]
MSPEIGKCGKCHNSIVNRQFLTCTLCEHKYHLDCVSVSPQRYGLLCSNPDGKKKWKCKFCLQSKLPQPKRASIPRAITTPKTAVSQLIADIDSSNVTIREKQGSSRCSLPVDNNMNNSIEIGPVSSPQNENSCVVSELRLLREQVTIMNTNLLRVLDSVQRCHEKIDECSVKLVEVDERLITLETQNAIIFKEPTSLAENSSPKRRRPKKKAGITNERSKQTDTNASVETNPNEPGNDDNSDNASKPGTHSRDAGSVDSKEDSENSDMDESPWIDVRKKKKQRREEVFQRGTAGPDITSLRAVESRKLIHLWNMESGVEEIRNYLQQICGPASCDVEELKARGAYKSYKISVPEALFEKCVSPSIWPNNARIKEWTPFRRWQQKRKSSQ